MPVDLTSVVVRSAEPMSAIVKETLVLFSAERSKYYVFDDISTAIWHSIAQPVTVADLCRRLEHEFEAEVGQCQADVLKFLSDLEARGLVRLIS